VPLLPHEFWQTLDPPGTHTTVGPFTGSWPATLPDGRQLLLPIRVLPGDGTRGVAGLISNQASLVVLDALVEAMAAPLAAAEPDLIIGVPTLGLPLAEGVARRLGHSRLLPLSTSRKFWHQDELSEPLSSITTPERRKSLFIDPRLLPLLDGRRIVVIDDVVSSGQSMVATLRLLRKVGVTPVAISVAMRQGDKWRAALAAENAGWPELVQSVFGSPLLRKEGDGWMAS
jgi:adenine/guanine phosphoribosyltransferase-like PRPP-binding protein